MKFLNPFHKPTAAVLIVETLKDYERSVIESEAAAAYHRKMAEFYREGINRLKTQAH